MGETPGKARPSPPVIHHADLADLDSLVECYFLALPEEPMVSLGRAFLRARFRYYIEDADGFCLVMRDEEDGRVTGFVFGGGPGMKRRFIRSNLLRFAGTVLWKALFHRCVRRRVREPLGTIIRRIGLALHLLPDEEKYRSPPEEPEGTYAVLRFLGTHPEYRRRGIATALLDAFRCECAKRGYRIMRLMTEKLNSAAIALYEENGWKIVHRSATYTYFRRTVQE